MGWGAGQFKASVRGWTCSSTCWVLPLTLPALSVKVNVPDVVPLVVGARRRPTTQLAPGASGTEVEQVVVCGCTTKFALTAIWENVSAPLPMLDTVTVLGPSDEPMGAARKLIGAAAAVTLRTRSVLASAM